VQAGLVGRGVPRERGLVLAGAIVRTDGLPPDCFSTLPIQASKRLPDRTTSFAPAVALTSFGRGSYSCGSVFGVRIWWTSTAEPPTARTKSPSCVVVATTRGRPPEAVELDAQPETTTAASNARRAGRTGRRRRVIAAHTT